jgi:hypothetical protein
MGNTLSMTDKIICTCQAGYALNSGTGFCQWCPKNYYCPGGDLPAQSCPNASLSFEGSTAQTDCVCGPGYTGPTAVRAMHAQQGSGKLLTEAHHVSNVRRTRVVQQQARLSRPAFASLSSLGLASACVWHVILGRTSKVQEPSTAATALPTQQHVSEASTSMLTVCASAAWNLSASSM